MFAQTAYQAEKFEASLMQNKKGGILIYNGEKHSFSININGKIEFTESPGIIKLNGKLLQSQAVPFAFKADFEHLTVDQQQEYLLSHMNWEMDYMRKQLKNTKLTETNQVLSLNDHTFLLWYFDMPKSYKTVSRQYYLTTVCFDQILILNAPVDQASTFEEIKNNLIAIATTLKQNNQPIDLEKLYYELQK